MLCELSLGPKPTLPSAARLSAKAVTCCGRYARSTAPTANAACACRYTAAASYVLPAGSGAIWPLRGRSGGRSSSASRPSGGLQAAGHACHAGDSRHRRFPGRQRLALASARQSPQHPVHPRQRGLTSRSSSRRSRPPCRQSWRGVPAAAGHSLGPSTAAGCRLCSAGRLATPRP
jgi:hypothetical protein